MAYLFPDIKKEVYSKTFLRDVHIRIDFDGESAMEANAGNVCQYYNEEFGMDVSEENARHGMNFVSEDNKVRFEFSCRHVELTMFFPAYQSFDSVWQWKPRIDRYMKILGIDRFDRLTIWKYNELPFAISDTSSALSEIIPSIVRQLFSDELLGHNVAEGDAWPVDKTDFSNMKRWEIAGVISGEDEWKSSLSYEYGFKLSDDASKEGVLSLKTMIASGCAPFDEPTLNDILWIFNGILDRAFHWCVRPEIIEMMKEK